MKKYSLIVYILNGFSQLWLLVTILYCLMLAFFLITGKDGYLINNKNTVLGSPNIYKDGYPIQAKLSIQMPADTIVEWEGGTKGGGLNLRRNEPFRFSDTDSILNDTAIKKEYYFSKWLAEPGFNDLNSISTSYDAEGKFALFDTIVKHKTSNFVATVESNYFQDVQVKLKSKSKIQNFALALHSLISAITMLLISFNVFKLFQYIRSGDNFLSPLYKKIFFIGIVLVISELIKLILSFLYAKWYGAVRLEKVSSIAKLGGQEFNVHFNPTLDFNLSFVLFGLSLIVIASLFKYGNKLQQEQALTI